MQFLWLMLAAIKNGEQCIEPYVNTVVLLLCLPTFAYFAAQVFWIHEHRRGLRQKAERINF